MLGVIQILSVAVSLVTFLLLNGQLESLSHYQPVFIRSPEMFFLDAFLVDADNNPSRTTDCPPAFDAPLSFATSNLVNYINLKRSGKFTNADPSAFRFNCTVCLHRRRPDPQSSSPSRRSAPPTPPPPSARRTSATTAASSAPSCTT